MDEALAWHAGFMHTGSMAAQVGADTAPRLPTWARSTPGTDDADGSSEQAAPAGTDRGAEYPAGYPR